MAILEGKGHMLYFFSSMWIERDRLPYVTSAWHIRKMDTHVDSVIFSIVLPILGGANPHWHSGKLGKC